MRADPKTTDATPTKPQVIYMALGIHRRGGMERAAFEVIERIKLHRTVVVIARECENDNVEVIPVWAPRRPAVVEVAWYKWASRRAMHRRLRKSKAVHATTGIGASGGPVDVAIAQYCQEAYRQRIGPVRANNLLKRWWQRWVMNRFCAEERAVYQNQQLKRVIAVSRGVGAELIEFYDVDPDIIRYVPNGVDLSTFKPLDGGVQAKQKLRSELALPSSGLLACFVGGDWRRKGLLAAIQAVGKTSECHLVVVGSGDQAEFKALADAAGAGAQVHFVGKQPDPHRYMQAADVYLFPSLYEAFSLSCIEAAACGLPLIVTRINGTDELVNDGVNGFFIDHDRDSIAARLRELIDNPQLRDRMSQQAAEDAKRYQWDIIAAGHEAVYAELDAEEG